MQNNILLRAIHARLPAKLLLSLANVVDKLSEQTHAQLIALDFSDKQAERFLAVDTIEADLEWLQKDNHHLLNIFDADYPQLLRQIYDPPIGLYVIGNPELLQQPQLAMVGSRNPTHTGRQIAEQFANHLADIGLCVTSGLATGIDAASHEGALIASGKTIAVCGTGLDRVYPARHRKLAGQIAEYGALVSEFPIGTKPQTYNFPRRNRIISGLSIGTLVVEAAIQSGSLITARQALEQGREVFAVPGSIHNPLAKGCHQLIRQGAKLVETAADILEELGQFVPFVEKVAGKAADSALEIPQIDPILDKDYQQLLDCVGFETTAVDVIVARSGLAASQAASMLLILELNLQVAIVPGGYLRCKAPRE